MPSSERSSLTVVNVAAFAALLAVAACGGTVASGGGESGSGAGGTSSSGSSGHDSSNGLTIAVGSSASSSGEANTGPSSSSGGETGDTQPGTASSSEVSAGSTNTQSMISSPSQTIGEPCIPSNESDPTFQGYSVDDVSVGPNAACGARNTCLVNHFQGRASCPYGQLAPGQGPKGPAGSPAATEDSVDGCILPGMAPDPGSTSWQVLANDVSIPGSKDGAVPAQIVGLGRANRTANAAVYCSCRCANADGRTDDGETYCACPGGLDCQQLIEPFGTPNDAISGAYCVVQGTTYNPAASTADVCDADVTDSANVAYCPLQK